MGVYGTWYVSKTSKSSYIYECRKRFLNWRKLGKWWLYVQIFSLLIKVSFNPNLSWVLTFGFPALAIILILFCYFFSSHEKTDNVILESKEYKSFLRDKKIDQIINK